MEMAIGKAAIGLTLSWAPSWAQTFAASHHHLIEFCAGTLTIDASALRFNGRKRHVWNWSYVHIQQLTLYPGSVRILSYKDSSTWKLGKDVSYTSTGKFPTEACNASGAPNSTSAS